MGNLVAMGRPKKFELAAERRSKANFIAEWRNFRGFTQEQLAEAVGTTKATISRIESGDIANSSYETSIARALGTHRGILLMRGPIAEDTIIEPKRAKR